MLFLDVLQSKLIHFFNAHQDLATVDSILLRELPPVEDVDAVSYAYITSSSLQANSDNMLFLFFLFPTIMWVSKCVQRLALKRLVDISMGVLTPLSEQLTKPLPHAIPLVNLEELSSGAHKLLPEGTDLNWTMILSPVNFLAMLFSLLDWGLFCLVSLDFFLFGFCAGTRLAVTLRGDESYEQLAILKGVDDITMLLHNVPYSEEKTGRVHAGRR
jgi:(E)-4-hydroxy-3-methylbut-2-enyl-diphosphate synthase